MSKDTEYLVNELEEALRETRRSLSNKATEHYRGDATEIKRRATELSGALFELAERNEDLERLQREAAEPLKEDSSSRPGLSYPTGGRDLTTT